MTHVTRRDPSAPPTHPAVYDRQLRSLLAPLLEDPPSLPDWPAHRWRSALRSSRSSAALPAAAADPRLDRLFAWLALRTSGDHRVSALAALLEVLGAAIKKGERDVAALAERVITAVAAARAQRPRVRNHARVVVSADMDRWASPSSHRSVSDDSSILCLVALLLAEAGYDIEVDPVLSARLAAALDVALRHWLDGTDPGGDLPDFRPEGSRWSQARLAVLLGGDRELLPLVYGPQPGRGRPLQVARRRGLLYWVARMWRAETLAELSPVVPPHVLAHWARELARLGLVPEASAWKPGSPDGSRSSGSAMPPTARREHRLVPGSIREPKEDGQ